MTIDSVVAAARELGFGDLDVIRALARRTVALRPEEESASSPLGSRLGGLPALPVSLSWPQCDARSLAFIGQIDLASQPRIPDDQGFPNKGRLSFFYDADQSTWGFDPKDADSFTVIYVPEPSAAAVVTGWPDDLPEYARYNECRLVHEETVTLPPWDSVLVDNLDLDPEQLNAYQDLLERMSGDDGPSRGLLGGHPDQIQGDMMSECAMVRAGIYCGDSKAHEDPRVPELLRHAHEWRLLLQVPSSDAAGMMWGDAGCLYYWIHEDDLKAQRFERSWMILQCG